MTQAQGLGSRLSESWERYSKLLIIQDCSFFPPFCSPSLGSCALGSLWITSNSMQPEEKGPSLRRSREDDLGLLGPKPYEETSSLPWCPFPRGSFPGPLYQSTGSPEAEGKGPQHLATFSVAFWGSPPRFHLRIAWGALKKYKSQI